MDSELKKTYLEKVKKEISMKRNTYKKIMLKNSEELIYLRDFFYIYRLYEELKGDGDFIHRDVFYKYMRMITKKDKN